MIPLSGKPIIDDYDLISSTWLIWRLRSITQRVLGELDQREFSYGYRIAKCAQNMLSLCLTSDPEMTGNIILSVNPGLLQTDSGSSDALHSAAQGAEAVFNLVSRVNESGLYNAFGGEPKY